MKRIFCLFIVGGLCIGSGALAANLLDDAVGIWLFDEGKGNVAADTSGNGNDGAIAGAKWRKANSAVPWNLNRLTLSPSNIRIAWLHRSDDYRNLGLYERWRFIHRDSAERCLSSRSAVSNRTGAGGYVFGIWSGGGFTGGVWGKTVLEFEQWYHVVGLYDGEEMRIYVDGTLEAAKAQKGDVDGAGELLFGTFGGEKFLGRLDEVVFFGRAITTDEIAALMEGVEAVLPVSPRGMLTIAWGHLKTKNLR